MPKEEISHIFPNCENASLLAVGGITIACLRGITCVEDEWEDDGGFIHVGCINSLAQQLASGTQYFDESCD